MIHNVKHRLSKKSMRMVCVSECIGIVLKRRLCWTEEARITKNGKTI